MQLILNNTFKHFRYILIWDLTKQIKQLKNYTIHGYKNKDITKVN